MYNADVDQWIGDAADYLSRTWGIDRGYARAVAVMLVYLHYYGVSFAITSGYRDAEKQEDLRRRWAAGDRSVVVEPAAKSQHSTTTWLGAPAATAIDIQTSDPATAAAIAVAVGIGAGYYYRTPDPVHFYQVT